MVYDAGLDGGVCFIVTELLEGQTLAERAKSGPIPRAQAIAIAMHVARGVAAVHARGIVHRDLKPSNVFLCRDRRVKVLDFGLASYVAGADRRAVGSAETETGATPGTPAYMSPEQVRGERVDERADVFALGAILYEMSTGRPPFDGGSGAELGYAIVTREPPPLGDPELDAVVRACMQKDPALRPRSAAAVARLLEMIGASPDPLAAAETNPRPGSPAPSSGRRPLLGSAPRAPGWRAAPPGRCPRGAATSPRRRRR
jgi:serine/threonine protein kinase